MQQTRREYLFQRLQQLIHCDDYTSIAHVLRWEHRKDELFDLKNDEGLTLIHIACFEGQVRCLEEFLKNGASVNLQSSVGWTPLHAATLGGKLEVVEYLLSQCAADPLAKDEMGCVASDLTMDSDILKTINRYANELNLRRELERVAGQQAVEQSSKRNTLIFETNDMVISRSTSAFTTSYEAREIEEHHSNILPITGRSLLQIPGQPVNTDTTYLVRHNSAPIQKTSPNTRRSESSSESSEQNSPSLTRFYKQEGKRVSTSRDSGVFDDESDMDSLTDQLIKRKLSSISQTDHYNMI
ncbi:oxysterol-binding protein-related protein 1-like [Clytia hemisphaerica]|uniref:ANK_REP_REGION domain-containing protein n=1 Tax=Clytia hemisphaerica TaxID=252671 RepID=A0A7M5UL10_9CNID